MKYFTVSYNGNSIKYQNFEERIKANTEREAVEQVYAKFLDENYFPQDDGSIQDCDGHEIASATDTYIEHDGGYFGANLTDMFEHLDECPREVQKVVEKYSDIESLEYYELETFLSELNEIGWTFEYYLDGIPFNLQPIN